MPLLARQTVDAPILEEDYKAQKKEDCPQAGACLAHQYLLRPRAVRGRLRGDSRLAEGRRRATAGM